LYALPLSTFRLTTTAGRWPSRRFCRREMGADASALPRRGCCSAAPRRLLLLLLILAALTCPSVGGLPSNCATPTKKLRALAMRMWDPTAAGKVFCPLRRDPIEHLEASFAHIAGQDNARVRLCRPSNNRRLSPPANSWIDVRCEKDC